MRSVLKISSVAVLIFFAFNVQGFGQTVTPTSDGTGISADNAPAGNGAWRTLNDILIEETAPGQLQPGDIRLQVPNGFEWDTGGADPTFNVTSPKKTNITVTLSSRSSSEIVFNLSGTSTGPPKNNPHTIEFDGLRIRPSQGSPLASGEIRNAGSSAPGGTTNYGTISMVAGADNKVRVETQPNSSGSVVAVQDLEAGNSISVYSNVRDQFNNFKRNESATWSLQNTTDGVVISDLSASGTSATFTGDLVGSANIQATVGSLNTVQSGTITVIPSNATTLIIATQPSSTATAGTTFGTQPVIEIQDDYTNVITDDNLTQITASRNSGEGALQGTKTITVSNGIATFSNLSHQVSNTIDLTFSATGFSSVTSNSITINPAAADKLTFTVQPANGNRNTALSPPVEVQIQDQFSNNVSDQDTTVTLSLNSGSGNISGNTATTNASGTAVFNSVSFNQTGTKNIIASATGLNSSGVSNDFTIANAGTLAGFEIELSGGGTIGTQTAGKTTSSTAQGKSFSRTARWHVLGPH
ncbi:hypothetical protein [Gracilimonas sp.]|uniref:hypothetical protein n=1 Tax=Gracilimonas sp. TaxID=1974203 RepID=UPI002871F9B2|nr:hypothetical protein [Gracilimonas sp.]